MMKNVKLYEKIYKKKSKRRRRRKAFKLSNKNHTRYFFKIQKRYYETSEAIIMQSEIKLPAKFKIFNTQLQSIYGFFDKM